MRRRAFPLAILLASLPAGAAEQTPGPSLAMKVGQAIVFRATVENGAITLGKPAALKPGGAPQAGEIAVTIVKQGTSPYADLTATETTSAPVDFVATSLVGNIMVDEVRLCGRLDAPMTAHVYAGAWRISLNRFRPGGQGAPGCP